MRVECRVDKSTKHRTQPDDATARDSTGWAWLGHVSLSTTNVYAEVDLEMKAAALANCEVKEDTPQEPWREDKGLMEFLRSLQAMPVMWRPCRDFSAAHGESP